MFTKDNVLTQAKAYVIAAVNEGIFSFASINPWALKLGNRCAVFAIAVR